MKKVVLIFFSAVLCFAFCFQEKFLVYYMMKKNIVIFYYVNISYRKLISSRNKKNIVTVAAYLYRHCFESH